MTGQEEGMAGQEGLPTIVAVFADANMFTEWVHIVSAHLQNQTMTPRSCWRTVSEARWEMVAGLGKAG